VLLPVMRLWARVIESCWLRGGRASCAMRIRVYVRRASRTSCHTLITGRLMTGRGVNNATTCCTGVRLSGRISSTREWNIPRSAILDALIDAG